MSNPKRHHYLPEFYLDRFAGSGGFLWLFDRSQGKLRKERPRNTAVIGHYYSFTDEAGERSPAIEQYFSEVERVAKATLDCLESGEEFTRKDRFRLSWFLGYLFCRVPAYERALNETITGLVQVVMRKNLEDPETANSFDLPPKELLKELDSEDFLLKVNDNLRLAHVLQQGEEIAKKFFFSSWVVARAPARGSFVTCDNPFGLIFPPGTPKSVSTWSWGAFSPEVTRAFPLSSRTCLLMHGMTGSSLDSIELDRDAVREINLAIVTETETYAIARDEDHLRSLALAGDLHNPKPCTRTMMENHPDPSGDPTRSTLNVRRARVR
jgi:hypothetical protein